MTNQRCIITFVFKDGRTVTYRMDAELIERFLRSWRASPEGTGVVLPVETMDGRQEFFPLWYRDLLYIEPIEPS
jgi:hypothetical protein